MIVLTFVWFAISAFGGTISIVRSLTMRPPWEHRLGDCIHTFRYRHSAIVEPVICADHMVTSDLLTCVASTAERQFPDSIHRLLRFAKNGVRMRAFAVWNNNDYVAGTCPVL